MEFTKPAFSQQEVNEAGKVLLEKAGAILDHDLDHALEVINNWRSSHGFPLQCIKMTLKRRAQKFSSTAPVVQRTKRIHAIRVKLENNPNMKLATMHDIGGCRAILPNALMVEKVVRLYEKAQAKSPHRGNEYVRTYDYINEPKSSGYRGVHLIYKYRSEAEEFSAFNGRKIEIQIRSKLQHAWATAVETVDFFTQQALKSNMGDEVWKNFFVLISSAFAISEQRPVVLGMPNNLRDLKGILKGFKAQVTILEGIRKATETVAGYGKGAAMYLLQLDSIKRNIKIQPFGKSDFTAAQEKYLVVP